MLHFNKKGLLELINLDMPGLEANFVHSENDYHIGYYVPGPNKDIDENKMREWYAKNEEKYKKLSIKWMEPSNTPDNWQIIYLNSAPLFMLDKAPVPSRMILYAHLIEHNDKSVELRLLRKNNNVKGFFGARFYRNLKEKIADEGYSYIFGVPYYHVRKYWRRMGMAPLSEFNLGTILDFGIRGPKDDTWIDKVRA